MTAPKAIVVVPADSWEAVIAALERAVDRLENLHCGGSEYDPLTVRAIEAGRNALDPANRQAYKITWEI